MQFGLGRDGKETVLAENMNSIFSGYSRLELRKVEEELRKLNSGSCE